MGQENWNSKAVTPITAGKLATEFHGGWINYKKADGNWSPVDCLLVQDGSGFHVTKAPFEFTAPLLSDGEATFNVNNRYDIFNKTEITADPFSQTIKALGVSSVSGELYDINGNGRLDAVKYPNAYGVGIHLVFYVEHGRAPRLKKLVQFDSALGVDTDYEFELTYSGKVEISPRKIPSGMTRLEHYAASEATLNNPTPLSHDNGFYIRKFNEAQKRGIGIKTPLIWDSGLDTDRKSETVDTDIRKGVGVNKYILTKHIKASFFSSAVYPVFTDTSSTFYPDPSVESTSVDGYINENGTSWDATHDATDAASADTTDVILNSNAWKASSSSFFIRRAIALFDTSSILAEETVTSATLSLYITVIFDVSPDDTEGYMGIVTSTPASNTDVVVGDFDQVGDAIDDPTQVCTAIDMGAMSAGAYSAFTFTDLTSITKAGITKLGFRCGHDIEDAPHTVINDYAGITCSSADETAGVGGIDQDPTLVVEHGVAAQKFIGGRPSTLLRKGSFGGKNPFIK